MADNPGGQGKGPVGVRGRSAILLLTCLVLGCATPSLVLALEPVFPDSALGMITVGRPLATDEIKRLRFEPAEAIRTDQSSSGADVLRFERGAGDAVQFIELAVRDRAVQAVGWTRVLSKA